MAVHERKTVNLNRVGGSYGVVLPKRWLEAMAVTDRVDLVRTEEGIMVTAHRETVGSIEEEPEFAHFLDFMTRSALRHPEDLVDAATFMSGDEDLLEGVEVDLDEVLDRAPHGSAH